MNYVQGEESTFPAPEYCSRLQGRGTTWAEFFEQAEDGKGITGGME